MGVHRVDTHVKILDDRVRRRAIGRGLDAIVYAPHFTQWPDIVERANRFSDDRLTVVPGREIFTGTWQNRKHILAIGLSRPVPDFIDLGAAMEELREQEACVIVPHPGYLSISMSPADLRTYRSDIDAVEVYNPKFLPWHGPRARKLASAIEKTPVVSSYAHLASSVGTATIGIDRAINQSSDLIEAIKTDAISVVDIPPFRRRWRSSLGELMHLVWENTVKKARHKVRGETVATHPSVALYDGRFAPTEA